MRNMTDDMLLEEYGISLSARASAIKLIGHLNSLLADKKYLFRENNGVYTYSLLFPFEAF